VAEHLSFRDLKLTLQSRHECLHRTQLGHSRRLLVEIADQADADAVLIVFEIPGVRSLGLFVPAEGGLHFSVGHPLSVTDDEVIGNAPPRFSLGIDALGMFAMNARNTSQSGGAVVEHNVFPAPQRSVGFDRNESRKWDGSRGTCYGCRDCWLRRCPPLSRLLMLQQRFVKLSPGSSRLSLQQGWEAESSQKQESQSEPAGLLCSAAEMLHESLSPGTGLESLKADQPESAETFLARFG